VRRNVYVLRNTFFRLTLDLGVVSDQQGNAFTRVLPTGCSDKYQGEWSPSVLADYRSAFNL